MQYGERCAILKWSPLEKRILYFFLIECYKLVFSLNNLKFQEFFDLASRITTTVISYKLKYLVVTVTKYYFFVRIVNEWNDLPEWVVGAGNLAYFKNSLGSFLNIS